MDDDLQKRIPLNQVQFCGNEFKYLKQCLELGHVSGDGSFTQRCHKYLEESLSVPRALLTTSCTAALEMSALLLNISSGDEVIVPAFTFVSTVNAFVLRGAKPVFVDVRRDTLNIDESQLESKITSMTRAIVVVHYAGVGCEMDVILEIARRHRLPVVEDNAHGLFAKYRGKYLGTWGDLATQSFHQTKNFTCGEGGALLINRPEYIERAEVIREKGTNRGRFSRGQVDKYSWIDVGSSYLASDISAALLLAQLEQRDLIQSTRLRIWNQYLDALGPWAQESGVELPKIPPQCEHPGYIFYLLLPTLKVRQQLTDHLHGKGIASAFHFLPLHLSEMGRRFGGRHGDCPITEEVSDRLLRLPIYSSLTPETQAQIIEAVLKYNSV